MTCRFVFAAHQRQRSEVPFDGEPLARLQQGHARKNLPLAWSGERKPDAKGKIPPVRDTVDVVACSGVSLKWNGRLAPEFRL